MDKKEKYEAIDLFYTNLIDKMDLDNKILDVFFEEFSWSEVSTMWPTKEKHHSFIYLIGDGSWICQVESEYYLVIEHEGGGFTVNKADKEIFFYHVERNGSELDKKVLEQFK